MNSKSFFAKLLTPLLAPVLAMSSVMFVATATHAQPSKASASSRIDGFDVDPVSSASAGRELMFTLYGSPGGTARVQIGGATGNLLLEESEPGVYEGVYTIRSRDKITSSSTATANLRQGNQVATALVGEPLVGTSKLKKSIPNSSRVRLDRFGIDQPQGLSTGNELRFNLTGTPDSVASVRLGGVPGKVNLTEVRSGVYQGAYVIHARDRLNDRTTVTPYLRQGSQETAIAGQTIGFVANQAVAKRPVAPPTSAPVCNLCGTVEAVNPVQVKGEGSLLGKVGGGVVGALLGNQIGKGDGRKVATVAGAIGGAFAGNEVEKRVRNETHYEVVVRLDNGGSQTVKYAEPPNVNVGARVRVEGDGTALRAL